MVYNVICLPFSVLRGFTRPVVGGGAGGAWAPPEFLEVKKNVPKKIYEYMIKTN